jgi:citrate synthase
MCGGIGGATAAAALMAALAVGAGRHGGAREVRDAMLGWTRHGENIDAWAGHADTTDQIDVWPDAKHVPGFDPHGASTPLSVVQLLAQLAKLNWLARCRAHLESAIGLPLAMTGIAAATFADLGFTPDEGEMLYLLLRLPGAAAHALEQQAKSYKDFPFPEVILEDDPARGGA